MGLLQELFRTHGPAYLDRFGPTMPKAHKKVIAAITDCHTEAAGSTLYVCEACGQQHMVHRSWPGFYLPVRALSIVRAKFRDQIDKRGLLGDIPPEVWAMEWNVNCQAAGDGHEAVSYLAHYVFKVAIAERLPLRVSRILVGAAILFLVLGGLLALVMRTQLAVPDNDLVDYDTYNQLFTMHGTVMLLFYATPIVFGFANLVLPLQIGAPDMAFPRLNALSFWMLPLAGGVVGAVLGDLGIGEQTMLVDEIDGDEEPARRRKAA